MKNKKNRKESSEIKEVWSLSAKKIDSTHLFQKMSELFTGSYTIFLEGTSISDKAEFFYRENSSQVDYLPQKSTIWPKSRTFSCDATKSFWNGLIELSKNHAEPELFDHFFICKKSTPIVEWWDAFLDPLYLSACIPESKINAFATRMGFMVKKIREKNS